MANSFIIIEGKNQIVRSFDDIYEYICGGRLFCAFLRAYDAKGKCVDICTKSRSVRKFFERFKGFKISYINASGYEFPAYMEL